MPATSSWAPGRRERPRGQAQDHRREFVEVFKAEAAKLKAGTSGHKGATWLAQGTIYPT
jgi:GMP synthase PP-ATPase subunit